MPAKPNGSNGYYRTIAELLAERFRQGRLSAVKEHATSDNPVFTVAFDGPFCDVRSNRDETDLIDQLAKQGRCFVGISEKGGGAKEILADTWKTGIQPAKEILARHGKQKDPSRPLEYCGEAKVLIKLCSRIVHDVYAYHAKNYVLCSFELYSPSKLHLKDPCKNCQTWVFEIFGRVLCHQSARPESQG